MTKRIVLIGDSVCIGYREYVKKRFNGVADVFFPQANCAFAQNVLRYLNIWKDEDGLPGDADAVHFNAGLWDVLRIYGDETLTSPEYYGELILRIFKRIKLLFPTAKIIFATSTSVVESGYAPPYQRYNADIERFNEVAKSVLKPLGVAIDDLYAVTENPAENSECRSDCTHFNTESGVKLLGEAVINSICNSLEISVSGLTETRANVTTVSEKILRN